MRQGFGVSLRPLGAREVGGQESGPQIQDRTLQKLRGKRNLSKVSIGSVGFFRRFFGNYKQMLAEILG